MDGIPLKAYLKEIIATFKNAGIRVSIFVDPNEAIVEAAATTGTDRIELYTESYAKAFEAGKKEEIIQAYIKAAEKAKQLGLGINAGPVSYTHLTLPTICSV